MNMFDFSSLLHRSYELDPHIAHNNKKLSISYVSFIGKNNEIIPMEKKHQ